MPDSIAGDSRPMRERMRAGEQYRGGDEESGATHRRALELSDRYAQESLAGDPSAQDTLRQLLGGLGEGTHIRPPLHVDYGQHLFIGDDTFVNLGLTALDVAEIRIGSHCQLGPHVQLLTPTHPLEPDLRRDGWEAAEPITIGDNVWLGGGVIVCPGVTIGDDAVIGAGSVVTRDIPAGVVAVGNPARVIRSVAG